MFSLIGPLPPLVEPLQGPRTPLLCVLIGPLPPYSPDINFNGGPNTPVGVGLDRFGADVTQFWGDFWRFFAILGHF